MNTSVMFTDMVGYSKLTGDDQNLALELLREHDKIIEPIIYRYNGEIVKRIGDAIVAIFDNPKKLIQSSIEIQQSLKNRNTRNIQARHIILRIGLHYGDIILQEGEVHGSGYELAAKIEPICPYGGIAISEDLYNQVKEKDELIIHGQKNHFFIRPIATFDFQSLEMQTNIYKVSLNLLDWYDEPFNQIHDYLPKQGVASNIYTPLKFKRTSNHLVRHSKEANILRNAHNLSYAIYHYKMYIDYEVDAKAMLKLTGYDSLQHELYILGLFCQCGLVRLVARVIKTLDEKKCQNRYLYNFILGLNAFNANTFGKSLTHFEKSLTIASTDMERLSSYLYLFIIFYKNNQISHAFDLCDKLYKTISKSSNNYHIFIIQIIKNLLSLFSLEAHNSKAEKYKSEIQRLSLETHQQLESAPIHQKSYMLFVYWFLMQFYKNENDMNIALDIQDRANTLIENLGLNISGFQLKQFFLDKPLLHQLLMEEIEFDFVDDDGLDDFAEPKQIKTEQLTVFNFCIECGFKNDNQFHFCPSCGGKLTK